jgi:hypothetical protein
MALSRTTALRDTQETAKMKDDIIYSDFAVGQLKHFMKKMDKKYPSIIELWPRKVDEETTLKEHLKSLGIVNHSSIDVPYRLAFGTREPFADQNLLLHQKVEKVMTKVPNWEEDWKAVPSEDRPSPFRHTALPSADVVTNINLSGWVPNQHWFWENTHRMCKKNGIVFNLVPCVTPTDVDDAGWGKKDEDGQAEYVMYFYDKDFFDLLASKNGYKVLINELIEDEEAGYLGEESVRLCVFEKTNDDEFKGGHAIKRYQKA